MVSPPNCKKQGNNTPHKHSFDTYASILSENILNATLGVRV